MQIQCCAPRARSKLGASTHQRAPMTAAASSPRIACGSWKKSDSSQCGSSEANRTLVRRVCSTVSVPLPPPPPRRSSACTYGSRPAVLGEWPGALRRPRAETTCISRNDPACRPQRPRRPAACGRGESGSEPSLRGDGAGCASMTIDSGDAGCGCGCGCDGGGRRCCRRCCCCCCCCCRRCC